jgi:hypothetical protein
VRQGGGAGPAEGDPQAHGEASRRWRARRRTIKEILDVVLWQLYYADKEHVAELARQEADNGGVSWEQLL